MPGYRSVSAGAWVRTGSRHERAEESGAAHFLEHLLFKGTGKRSSEDLKRLVEGVGGTFNAFTSEDATCYFVKMPMRKHLATALDVLSDMVRDPALPAGEIEKERNVILEEIKMYQDIPQALVHELFSGLLFPGHPLGRSIAGTPGTVGALSREGLRAYWERFYGASSVVVSLAGDLGPDAEKLAEEHFGPLRAARAPGFEPAPAAEKAPGISFLARETEQVHFVLGGRGFSQEDPRRWALSLLMVILGGNMSSRLFVEVREKRGLVYQVAAASDYYSDAGLYLVHGGTSVPTLGEALRVIIEQLRLAGDELVGPEEFTRARDYVVGQLSLRLESTSEYMNFLGGQLARRGKIEEPDEMIARVRAVTREEISEVARLLFLPGNLGLALIGPAGSDGQAREALEKTVN